MRSRNAGFSLVEVTLALGIAALGIIAVLGLMPQGMEMSRRTGLLAAERQITEQIVRNLEQKSWTELNATTAPVRSFYDDQGLEVTNNSPVLAFVAEVQVQDLSTVQTLPSGASGEPFLRRVMIKIVNSPNPSFSFTGATQRRDIATMIHYIAKGG